MTRCILGLLSISSRHGLARFKDHMCVIDDSHHPLHGNIGDAKSTDIKSWIAQAETNVKVFAVENTKGQSGYIMT